MFSDKLKKELKNLGINTADPPNVIRQELEDMLDDRAQYINTQESHKYLKIEKVYSTFMEEYNEILDSGDALFI
jgi:hypothetical protein